MHEAEFEQTIKVLNGKLYEATREADKWGLNIKMAVNIVSSRIDVVVKVGNFSETYYITEQTINEYANDPGALISAMAEKISQRFYKTIVGSEIDIPLRKAIHNLVVAKGKT